MGNLKLYQDKTCNVQGPTFRSRDKILKANVKFDPCFPGLVNLKLLVAEWYICPTVRKSGLRYRSPVLPNYWRIIASERSIFWYKCGFWELRPVSWIRWFISSIMVSVERRILGGN